MSTDLTRSAADDTSSDRSTLAARLGLALLGVLLVAEGIFFLTYGRYNSDEGTYLYAGKLVFAEGLYLYGDFPFSQGPGGPYLYGAVGALFDWSVRTGRIASLILSVAGLGALTWLVRRVSGTAGATLMLLLVASNFPALWVSTQVRTDTGAVALTGLAAVAFLMRGGGALRWALAPALLAWATAFRVTHVYALAFVCLVIAWDLRRSPALLARTAGIVAASGLVAAFPLLAFPDDTLFHVYTSQLGRSERLGWSELPFPARLHFFRSPEKGFAGLLLLSTLPIAYLASRWSEGWRPGSAGRQDPVLLVFWLVVLALLTYLPLLVFQMGFATYFINASLLLSAAIAIAVPQLARRRGGAALWAGVALVWVCSAILAVRGYETFLDLSMPTHARLAPLRSQIQRLTGGDCTMLTLETQIATETGCSVPRGLEYSRFSYFPDMNDAEARQRGVLTPRLLREYLRDDPPEVLALTASAFEQLAGTRRKRPGYAIFPELKGRYSPLATVDVPIGITFRFWKKIEFYIRSDLLAGVSDSR